MAGSDIARSVDGPKSVMFEGARIIFRNFEGKEGLYNREGDRNFSVILDPAIGDQMKEDGWNVKKPQPREDGETRDPYLQVSVSFKNRPPRIVMITSRGRTDVPEDLLPVLDWVDIANVDLIVNPYQWSVNGRNGVKAYLKSIYITIQEDALELKYADVQEIQGSNSMLEYTRDDQLQLEAGQDPNVIDAEIVEDNES